MRLISCADREGIVSLISCADKEGIVRLISCADKEGIVRFFCFCFGFSIELKFQIEKLPGKYHYVCMYNAFVNHVYNVFVVTILSTSIFVCRWVAWSA